MGRWVRHHRGLPEGATDAVLRGQERWIAEVGARHGMALPRLRPCRIGVEVVAEWVGGWGYRGGRRPGVMAGFSGGVGGLVMSTRPTWWSRLRAWVVSRVVPP